jgi:thymidine kinase
MTTKNETSRNTGYLELIIGPMFSSKTTSLLEIYKKCKFCKKARTNTFIYLKNSERIEKAIYFF